MKISKFYLTNLMLLLKEKRNATGSFGFIIKSTKAIFILVFALMLASCSSIEPPPPPQMSELQIREIQTRQYENADYNEAMRATIASLQDQGFTITNANESLGLITAYKDLKAVDTWTEFWVGAQGSYQTIKRIEANATVRKMGKNTEIRISLVSKGMTNTGGVLWTSPIYDAEAYQKIFSKIDKSLFIEKEKVY